MENHQPKIIVIVGPTASGKSSLALEVAKQFNGEIIQADSRNIFRGMDIGTAKPVGERVDLRDPEAPLRIHDLFREKPLSVDGVLHWGIDLVDPDQEFTVAQFKAYAEEKIFEILKRGKLPILAGGTGLYISAVVDNLQFSEVPPNLALRKELDRLTNDQLEARLREVDPEAAETVDVSNRRRLLRAIEVVESTGKKWTDQQQKGHAKFDALEIGIDLPREQLYERIDMRVDEMIAGGLVDEVRGLKSRYGCEINSMTGIGYRQICAFLDGYMKLRDAIEVLKRDSRHYAKRQMTWFRRDIRIKWISTEAEALILVGDFLS